jgi:hypothetical protein
MVMALVSLPEHPYPLHIGRSPIEVKAGREKPAQDAAGPL